MSKWSEIQVIEVDRPLVGMGDWLCNEFGLIPDDFKRVDYLVHYQNGTWNTIAERLRTALDDEDAEVFNINVSENGLVKRGIYVAAEPGYKRFAVQTCEH